MPSTMPARGSDDLESQIIRYRAARADQTEGRAGVQIGGIRYT